MRHPYHELTGLRSARLCHTQLLTACERAFGVQIPHTALTEIRSVEDAARYWEQRSEMLAEAQQREQQHWTRAHPSNVKVLKADPTEESLQEWLSANSIAIQDDFDYANAKAERKRGGLPF